MRFTLLCSLALFGILSNGSIFARDNYCQDKHQDPIEFDIHLAHPTGSLAEWLPPKEILMHTPEEELFFGVIHPASALFERVFTASAAVKEHKQFIRLLEQNGLLVLNLIF